MLHYTEQERLARDKHSSLMGPLVSCEENKVLLELYSGKAIVTNLATFKGNGPTLRFSRNLKEPKHLKSRNLDIQALYLFTPTLFSLQI